MTSHLRDSDTRYDFRCTRGCSAVLLARTEFGVKQTRRVKSAQVCGRLAVYSLEDVEEHSSRCSTVTVTSIELTRPGAVVVGVGRSGGQGQAAKSGESPEIYSWMLSCFALQLCIRELLRSIMTAITHERPRGGLSGHSGIAYPQGVRCGPYRIEDAREGQNDVCWSQAKSSRCEAVRTIRRSRIAESIVSSNYPSPQPLSSYRSNMADGSADGGANRHVAASLQGESSGRNQNGH